MTTVFSKLFLDKNKDYSDGLKMLGFIFMFIDHIGIMFYPHTLIFRLLGRLAFPIFAYQLANGFFYTSNINRYLVRLWVLALISQIPFTLCFQTTDLNIFFTLFLSLLLLKKIKKKKYIWIPMVLISSNLLRIDYGIYGVITVLIFAYFKSNKVVITTLLLILNFLYMFLHNNPIQIFSMFSLIFIFLEAYLPTVKFNNKALYFVYPIHLIVLLFIKYLSYA